MREKLGRMKGGWGVNLKVQCAKKKWSKWRKCSETLESVHFHWYKYHLDSFPAVCPATRKVLSPFSVLFAFEHPV